MGGYRSQGWGVHRGWDSDVSVRTVVAVVGMHEVVKARVYEPCRRGDILYGSHIAALAPFFGFLAAKYLLPSATKSRRCARWTPHVQGRVLLVSACKMAVPNTE